MIVQKYNNSYQVEYFALSFTLFAQQISCYFYFLAHFLLFHINSKNSNNNTSLKKYSCNSPQETSDWELDLNQQDFKKFIIEGQLNQERFKFNQVHKDPYLLLNSTTLFQKTGFHEYFGYINYQIAKLTNSKKLCLQLMYNQRLKQQMIQELPWCNNNNGVSIIPWFWKGDSIQYLAEICLKVSIEDNQLQYQGGCYNNGFIYKELGEDNLQTFENLSIYIRHVNDPYISGVEYSHNYAKPKQDNHNQFPKFIYYCFLFGCAGIIYLIFIYLILTLRRNSEKTQFV